MGKSDVHRIEEIETRNGAIPVFIYLETRPNCRASIGRKGVHIRISRFLSDRSREDQIQHFKSWATEKLEKEYKFPEKRHYENGLTLEVGSRTFRIAIRESQLRSSRGRIRQDRIELTLAGGMSREEQDDHKSRLISRLVSRVFLPEIEARVHELNSLHFNKQVNSVKLKNNRSNWGSCSSKSNINLSSRLLFAPKEVIDYVIIHELAHLIERNHSKNFWRLVERAMPNYKECEKWLKKNHHRCYF